MSTKPYFPIGNWNHSLSIADFTDKDLEDWLFCGQTLPKSPAFSIDSPDEVAKMKDFIDAFHAQGFQVIPQERDLNFKCPLANDLPAYRAHFEKICETFGDHPGVYGFYTGDEPSDENLQQSIDCIRLQQEIAPHLSAYLNHHPWYSNWENIVRKFTGFGYLDNFIDWYVKESGIRMLSYDCYAHMLPHGDNGNKPGFDQYFQNLNGFHAGARKHNIPMWVFQLSSGHMDYRSPTEDDFRWQLNTALAHGAQGLKWFIFHMGAPMAYEPAPIEATGIRTERFTWLANVMRHFHMSTAALMTQLTLDCVQHVTTAYGDTELFTGQGLVSHAGGWPGRNLILSEFTHQNGEKYLMVTNNSQTIHTRFNLQIRGNKPVLHRIGVNGEEQPNAQCEQGRDYACLSAGLTPGMMALYRITLA